VRAAIHAFLEASKRLFFEKKKQKTFAKQVSGCVPLPAHFATPSLRAKPSNPSSSPQFPPQTEISPKDERAKRYHHQSSLQNDNGSG
jgi:hypothetical protein